MYYICMYVLYVQYLVYTIGYDQVRGVSKYLIVDIGVTIQGEEEDELPEVVLCQNRFQNVDLDAGEFMP